MKRYDVVKNVMCSMCMGSAMCMPSCCAAQNRMCLCYGYCRYLAVIMLQAMEPAFFIGHKPSKYPG